MNHKVNNVQQLYDDAKNLYTNVVQGKADNIVNSLNQAITTLKRLKQKLFIPRPVLWLWAK